MDGDGLGDEGDGDPLTAAVGVGPAGLPQAASTVARLADPAIAQRPRNENARLIACKDMTTARAQSECALHRPLCDERIYDLNAGSPHTTARTQVDGQDSVIVAGSRLRRRGLLAACVAMSILASTGIAHPVAAAAPSQGGVTLDRYGALHTFGGLSLNTSGSAQWTWDIARSVVLSPAGSGGWTLDGWGGIHAFGGAPVLSGTPSWPGWDIARALVVLPDGHSGYVLDGWGGIQPFGGAPSVTGAPYWTGRDIARGLDIHLGSNGAPDGGATLDATGRVFAFGNYPYTLNGTAVYPKRSVFQALHDTGGHVYAVGRFGAVVEETSGTPMSPSWSGYTDFGQDDAVRDVVLAGAGGGGSAAPPLSTMAQYAWGAALGPRGGVTLDGFGGVHPFGGLPLNTAGAPYWPNWDIARAVALLPDASGGWVLDGWGGVHPFGAAPGLTGTPYWGGWDLARGLVVDRGGHSGYVLDAWGAVHPFGGAPALNGAPQWRGFDLARGLAIHYTPGGTPDGGWVLDAWGGLHAFGGAAMIGGPQYWPTRNLYEHVHTTFGGHAYTIGRWGAFADISGENMRPFWTGYSDWGGSDLVRDVVLIGDDGIDSPAQPQSWAASAAWWSHVWVYAFNIAPIQQGLPLDCEAAALEEAMRAKGNDISQYTIFDALPNNTRGPATWSGGHIVQWGNPYKEFVGNVYGSESRGTGYGVYDPPLVAVAKQFGFNAVGIEGGSAQQVFTELAMGHPVLVITSTTFTPVATYWWTAYDGRAIPYSLADHAVTVVAEDGVAGTVTINDVRDGRMKTFSMAQFASFWTSYLDMAVVLQ